MSGKQNLKKSNILKRLSIPSISEIKYKELLLNSIKDDNSDLLLKKNKSKENFTIHKRPNDIDAIDHPEFYKPCEAESAWNFKWKKVVHALQNAWKKKSDAKKLSRNKKIYSP